MRLDLIFKSMFFICLIAIEYLATRNSTTELITLSWDKLNHLFAFFVLYILISLAYKDFSRYLKIFLLLLFAFQIEVYQAFLPLREFSMLDMFADSIGIIIALFCENGVKNFLIRVNLYE